MYLYKLMVSQVLSLLNNSKAEEFKAFSLILVIISILLNSFPVNILFLKSYNLPFYNYSTKIFTLFYIQIPLLT